jgi:malate dehydrogenase (oxaloacetate-decarboxylating)
MTKNLLAGVQLLRDPSQNKDSAFTSSERVRFGLTGLLPSAILNIEQQVEIELEHIFSKSEPLEQYIGLIALLDRNKTLFYRLVSEHIERLAPIIYTPTVGLACERFSHIFRRPRGLFISPSDRGQIEQCLGNFPQNDIRLIVVTDNERILGLGDQGAGGMAIPIGKLVLYCAGAGIPPAHCLPISLDVGTDNPRLLADPLYLGYRHRRLRGDAYDSLVHEFVAAIKAVFPRALLQWEDFKKANAFRLLERYEQQLPSFNDDIQGTAAVTLAGIRTGVQIVGRPLSEQRFLIAGAGAAGVGIGRLLRLALARQGLDEAERRRKLLFIDSGGVVHDGRTDLEEHKVQFAMQHADFGAMGFTSNLPDRLEEVIECFHPTVLIGTTGHPGDFTPGAIRAMASHCERPLIFPLSNPTSKAECTPTEALQNSQGRALVATGSPFEPVLFEGGPRVIGQCNNVFIFPGVGLGALIGGAKRITNSMFLVAAEALAQFTLQRNGTETALYPSLSALRKVSHLVALAVARTARAEALGEPLTDEQLETRLEQFCWVPHYGVMSTGSLAE